MVRSLIAGATLLATLVNGQSYQRVDNITRGAPTADLGYVKYQGYTNATAGINYFRGIPYAASPTGSLRWQKPRPIEASNNYTSGTVYNATQIAPACWQSVPGFLGSADPSGMGTVAYTEDCLIADVLIPSHPVSTALPVVVQIHGGGYTLGSAQTSPGDALVNASDGRILFVSMQYRLGIFGFLSGAEIAQDGVLNAGLLDQRACLDWVQRNIRAFGGDPSRVTIWGGSAGGGSVTAQLIAGGAYDEPPFSAAIPEYPWWTPFLNQSEQAAQYYEALTLSNCSSLECLRSLPQLTLATLGQAVLSASNPSAGDAYGTFDFGPVVDGSFIKELPSIAFSKGHFYDVPLLVDHDEYEGVLFSNRSQTTQTEETMGAERLFPFAGPAFFSRLYQLYPASDYNSTFFQRAAWFGDFIIDCPTMIMAVNAVDRNRNSSAVFKLTFAAGTEIHGATGQFLSSSITGFPDANNHTLAVIMSSYWISFVVEHDPNPLRAAVAPFWPSYVSNGAGNVANGESVGFDSLAVTYTTVSPKPDPEVSAKCDFFWSRQFTVQN